MKPALKGEGCTSWIIHSIENFQCAQRDTFGIWSALCIFTGFSYIYKRRYEVSAVIGRLHCTVEIMWLMRRQILYTIDKANLKFTIVNLELVIRTCLRFRQVRIRLSTLALKPREDVTRSLKLRYQWPIQKGLLSFKNSKSLQNSNSWFYCTFLCAIAMSRKEPLFTFH